MATRVFKDLPSADVPLFDVKDSMPLGFDWLRTLLNRLIFSIPWYTFFNRLAKANSTTIYSGTLSPDTKPTLGEGNAGDLFFATDYYHWYRWSGTAWNFADEGSEYIVRGTPNGGLWAPCDGGSYAFSQPDGTLTNKNSEDLREDQVTGEPLFLTAADAIGTRDAATNPSWATGAKTEGQSITHTHSVNISDGGAVEVQSGTGTTFQAGLSQIVDTGNASADHTHDLASDAEINPPSVTEGGLPFRKANVYFQRR